MNRPPTDRLRPGTPIEVRNHFDSSWAGGFTVERATPDGYEVRRQADGVMLPATIPGADVRSAPDAT